jgi:hypothetical protein
MRQMDGQSSGQRGQDGGRKGGLKHSRVWDQSDDIQLPIYLYVLYPHYLATYQIIITVLITPAGMLFYRPSAYLSAQTLFWSFYRHNTGVYNKWAG